jgi:hypothetical protein
MNGMPIFVRIFIGMCLLLIGSFAAAATHYWDNGNGNYNWYDPVNWDPNSLPSGYNAEINAYCDPNHFVLINTAGSTAYCDTLTLGKDSGDGGYLKIGAGTLYTYGDQRVGYDGIGYILQTGGENNNYSTGSTYDLYLGRSDTGAGTYELQGGTLWTHNEYIGYDGVGFFNQTGGTNHIGHSSNSDGERDLRIGNAGSGVDGTGTYRLAGTGELILENSDGNIYVGDHYISNVGVGRFEWLRSGGLTLGAGGGSGKMIFDTYSSDNTLAIGYNYNVNDFLSNSKYENLAGNTLEVTNGATATCNITNTPSVTHFRVGSWTGAGYFTMTGGSWSVTQNFIIGDSGTGYVTVSGGTLHPGGHTYLDAGAFTLSGTGVLNSGWLHIGNGGTGTFTQTGGSNNLDGIIYLGSSANGSGTYRFAGGVLQHITYPTAGWMEIGLVTNATGRFEWFSSGTVDLIQIKLGSNGTLAMGRDFTVGNLTSGALYGGSAPSGLNSAALEITNGSKATHDNVSMTVKNLTVGSGTGAGTYTLSGVSTQLTVASGGALRIGADGTGRLEWLNGTLASPNMTLGSGATLAMGIDFTVSSLTSGSLYGGSAPQNLNQAVLEITNSATATQNSGSVTVGSLRLGSSTGGGTYNLSGAASALTIASSDSLRIGADGSPGRLEWYAGALSAPNMIFGVNGVLALGIDFNMSNLVSGALYGGSAPQNLDQAALEINNASAVHGTGSTPLIGRFRLAATPDKAGYAMSDGILIANTIEAGSVGAGTFSHTGGTVSANTSLIVGYLGGATGAYLLQGGSLTGTGGLTVRSANLAEGTFSGYGTVSMTGLLANNGRIVADGLGTSRALDLSSFAGVSNPIENQIGQRHGWDAEDHGKLTLPSVNIFKDGIYNWGESPYGVGDPGFDQYIDLVDSLQISLKGVAAPAQLTGSLLATDNADLIGPFPSGSEIIGVWNLALSQQFTKANITFRYDDYLAHELGIDDESLLQVYQFRNGKWEQITSGIDTGNKWIYANGVTSFSQFAVGIVPEPSSIVLLCTAVLACLLYWRRR